MRRLPLIENRIVGMRPQLLKNRIAHGVDGAWQSAVQLHLKRTKTYSVEVTERLAAAVLRRLRTLASTSMVMRTRVPMVTSTTACQSCHKCGLPPIGRPADQDIAVRRQEHRLLQKTLDRSRYRLFSTLCGASLLIGRLADEGVRAPTLPYLRAFRPS